MASEPVKIKTLRETKPVETGAGYYSQKGRGGKLFYSGRVRPRQGTEVCNFGASPPLERFVFFRARQRRGEGVVRRNGCPKGCFWRVRFFSAPLRFVLKNTCEVLKTLRGQSRNGLSKNSLLDNRFCARRLRRSFGAPPFFSSGFFPLSPVDLFLFFSRFSVKFSKDITRPQSLRAQRLKKFNLA